MVATINRVKHTLDHVPANSRWSFSLPLGVYFKQPGTKGLQPMASAINTAIKQAVVELGLDKKGTYTKPCQLPQPESGQCNGNAPQWRLLHYHPEDGAME